MTNLEVQWKLAKHIKEGGIGVTKYHRENSMAIAYKILNSNCNDEYFMCPDDINLIDTDIVHTICDPIPHQKVNGRFNCEYECFKKCFDFRKKK